MTGRKITGKKRNLLKKNSPDDKKRFEDVFPKVIQKFADKQQFMRFARASSGLKMDQYTLNTLIEDNKHSVEELKLSILQLWRQNANGPGRSVTPKKLYKIVDRYFRLEAEKSGDSSAYEGGRDQPQPSSKKKRAMNKDTRQGNRTSQRTDVQSEGDEDMSRNQRDQDLMRLKGAEEDCQQSTQRCTFMQGLICGIFATVLFFLVIFYMMAMGPFHSTAPPTDFDVSCPPVTHPHQMDVPPYTLPDSMKRNTACHGEDFQRIRLKINRATHKAASVFSIAELKKPDFRVFPKTNVIEFYDTPANKQAYSPEFGLGQRTPRMNGKETNMSDFFGDMGGHAPRYVALVGGVGYGKTEMLKRFTLDVLKGSYAVLKTVEVVHFLNLRDLPANEKITVSNLFFGNLHFSAEEVECVTHLLLDQPHRFLFVLDGIDQYPVKLEGYSAHIEWDEKFNPSKILGALLSGVLFPHVRILISSRQHAIRHFEGTMRPDKVIALSGFEPESIEKLVRTFGGTDGNRIWNHLARSPTLLSVSSIPMFLVFSVLVLKDRKENPPETLTEVLMHLLQYHVSSEHAHIDIIENISKLKPMSFQGVDDGRVTFTVSHLPRGITMDKADDMMIPLNGIKARNQRLLDGHFKIHFCHQSLQEALAALHVAEMPLHTFRTFISGDLHQPKWVIVRRLVCGLVLNPRTTAVARGHDSTVSLLNITSSDELEQKQEILGESLKVQLEELQGDGKRRTELLELLHALHECEDSVGDIVRSSMHEINFLNIPLTQSDFHVLLSTLNQCPNLMLLSLINCKLEAEQLQLLARTFKNPRCDFKVRILLIGNYENNLPPDSAEMVSNMVPFVTDLFWIGYRVEPPDILKLQERVSQLNRVDKWPTVVCWRKDTKRLVMLEYNGKMADKESL